MKVSKHANLAAVAIKSLDKFTLTPPERMAILKTAANIVENEIMAASLTIALDNTLNKGT